MHPSAETERRDRSAADGATSTPTPASTPTPDGSSHEAQGSTKVQTPPRLQNGDSHGTSHSSGQGTSHGKGQYPGHSTGHTVLSFIQQHPLVATGAALAIGATVVMAVRPRQKDISRLDRRAMQAVRNMERSFTREMRAIRRSDTADRIGRLSSSIGDSLARIDLSPLAERGHLLLEAARRRLG